MKKLFLFLVISVGSVLSAAQSVSIKHMNQPYEDLYHVRHNTEEIDIPGKLECIQILQKHLSTNHHANMEFIESLAANLASHKTLSICMLYELLSDKISDFNDSILNNEITAHLIKSYDVKITLIMQDLRQHSQLNAMLN